MRFYELLRFAQMGNTTAMEELLLMYQPLLLKEAVVEGVFDEDLYQELCIVFIQCVRKFRT